MSTSDELKWLLKVGGGHTFASYDISLKNTPTSHAVSQVCMLASCDALGCAITSNGVCHH